jgi:hypothetical protein
MSEGLSSRRRPGSKVNRKRINVANLGPGLRRDDASLADRARAQGAALSGECID